MDWTDGRLDCVHVAWEEFAFRWKRALSRKDPTTFVVLINAKNIL